MSESEELDLLSTEAEGTGTEVHGRKDSRVPVLAILGCLALVGLLLGCSALGCRALSYWRLYNGYSESWSSFNSYFGGQATSGKQLAFQAALAPVRAGSTRWQESELPGADLRDAHLAWVDLSRSNLSGADLSGANLLGAILSEADLSGADLSEADLLHADVIEADLTDADLSGAQLRGVDLSGSNLTGADLSGADLTPGDRYGAGGTAYGSGAPTDLSGANLTGADLSEADLTGAIVTDEQLAQAKSLQGATMPDGTVHE